MITFLSFTLIFVAISATLADQGFHPLSKNFIADINQKQSTWKAGKHFEIEDWELVKVISSDVLEGLTEIPEDERRNIHNEDDDVPESFDAREAWPECESIGTIFDQANCAASWAFASVEAMSDRICIHSNGTKKLFVSAQNLLSCGLAGTCGGGYISSAWNVWGLYGILTGGLYNRTDQGCIFYKLPPCDHYIENSSNPCNETAEVPACYNLTCDDTSLIPEDELTFGKDVAWPTGEKQLQLEILKNGPITVNFMVYTDFPSYQNGIYQQTSDEPVGWHAAKMLGWGVENGTKYWTVANSWNERWGENGYFRIIRGQNECFIEINPVIGLPDFSRF